YCDFLARAANNKPSMYFSAELSTLYSAETRRARSDSFVQMRWSVTGSAIFCVHSATLSGRTKHESPSFTSSSATPVKWETIQGVPHCIASLHTNPHASSLEGRASMRD